MKAATGSLSGLSEEGGNMLILISSQLGFKAGLQYHAIKNKNCKHLIKSRNCHMKDD